MPNDAKTRTQQQFGAHAAGYVESPVHKSGYSLGRLAEFVDVQPGWRVLDVATGGGHTALRLALPDVRVVAGDLTLPMLRVARDHIRAQEHGAGVTFAQLDAEALPFADQTFDAATCRVAPHHFPDVARFVREMSRVVKPGGVVGVVDQLTSPHKKAARYVNAFEKLRDPSHGWAYNRYAWHEFFTKAGLAIEHYEEFDTHHHLVDWAERMGNDAMTITRLRAMLVQAPPKAAEWMKPQRIDTPDPVFVIRQFLLVGRKGQ